MSLIEELVARNNRLTEENSRLMMANLTVLRTLESRLGGKLDTISDQLAGPDQEAIAGQRSIDITEAHTDLEIVVPGPCRWLQVYCDGVLDGISIKLGNQTADAYPLNRFDLLPVLNPNRIYLTNDIRPGRSTLVIYFVRNPSPLGQFIGGESVTRAELAARLGSINTYDRRGEVVWLDDFENGFQHWDRNTSGAGASVVLSPASSMRGSVAVKWTCGSNANHLAEITRPVAIPRLVGNAGFEGVWAVASDIDESQLLVDVYTGALVLHWGIRFVVATGQTAVLTAAGTWTNVDTGTLYPLYVDDKLFTHYKFVVELATLRYKRFLVGPLDIIGGSTLLTGYSGADASNAHVQITGRIIGTNGVNGVAYGDSFLITQNEPA